MARCEQFTVLFHCIGCCRGLIQTQEEERFPIQKQKKNIFALTTGGGVVSLSLTIQSTSLLCAAVAFSCCFVFFPFSAQKLCNMIWVAQPSSCYCQLLLERGSHLLSCLPGLMQPDHVVLCKSAFTHVTYHFKHYRPTTFHHYSQNIKSYNISQTPTFF